MYCPKCGKKLMDDAVFCYFCGTKIVIPEMDDSSVNGSQEKARERFEETDPFDIWDDTIREKPVKRGKRKRKRRKSGCSTAILVTVIILVVLPIIISSIVNRFTGNIYNTGKIKGTDAFYGGEEYTGSGAYANSSYTRSSSYSGNKQKSNNSVTCSMCGRSWEPSDSSGNYMKIVMSSMCKSCYNNFKQMEVYRDALGN